MTRMRSHRLIKSIAWILAFVKPIGNEPSVKNNSHSSRRCCGHAESDVFMVAAHKPRAQPPTRRPFHADVMRVQLFIPTPTASWSASRPSQPVEPVMPGALHPRGSQGQDRLARRSGLIRPSKRVRASHADQKACRQPVRCVRAAVNGWRDITILTYLSANLLRSAYAFEAANVNSRSIGSSAFRRITTPNVLWRWATGPQLECKTE